MHLSWCLVCLIVSFKISNLSPVLTGCMFRRHPSLVTVILFLEHLVNPIDYMCIPRLHLHIYTCIMFSRYLFFNLLSPPSLPPSPASCWDWWHSHLPAFQDPAAWRRDLDSGAWAGRLQALDNSTSPSALLALSCSNSDAVKWWWSHNTMHVQRDCANSK